MDVCYIPRKDALSKILGIRYTLDLKKNIEKLSVFVFDIFEKKLKKLRKTEILIKSWRGFLRIQLEFFYVNELETPPAGSLKNLHL